jgi:hypothetical protein
VKRCATSQSTCGVPDLTMHSAVPSPYKCVSPPASTSHKTFKRVLIQGLSNVISRLKVQFARHPRRVSGVGASS